MMRFIVSFNSHVSITVKLCKLIELTCKLQVILMCLKSEGLSNLINVLKDSWGKKTQLNRKLPTI